MEAGETRPLYSYFEWRQVVPLHLVLTRLAVVCHNENVSAKHRVACRRIPKLVDYASCSGTTGVNSIVSV